MELAQFKTQIELMERELQQAKTALEYSSEPKCALEFVPGIGLRSESPYFSLTNHGPGCLENVWLKETVFLVDTGGVHECLNLPHFEYILYCGSSRSMGSLEIGQEKIIRLDPCSDEALDLLFKKFPGKLVSRFRLAGSSLASPEFLRDFFFVIESNTLEYTKYLRPDEFTGGRQLVDSVNAYTHHGPKSTILYCFDDFFRDPPEHFYVTDQGKFVPWDGRELPPGTPVVSRGLPQEAVGSGSVKVVWSCDEVVGPIFRHVGCQSGAL